MESKETVQMNLSAGQEWRCTCRERIRRNQQRRVEISTTLWSDYPPIEKQPKNPDKQKELWSLSFHLIEKRNLGYFWASLVTFTSGSPTVGLQQTSSWGSPGTQKWTPGMELLSAAALHLTPDSPHLRSGPALPNVDKPFVLYHTLMNDKGWLWDPYNKNMAQISPLKLPNRYLKL